MIRSIAEHQCAECARRVDRAITFTGRSGLSLSLCEECLAQALEFLREGTVTIRLKPPEGEPQR